MLSSLLLSLTASAQQRLDEAIEVSIVNVDVQVTDKKGNRVTGLRAEDFEIREDGKVQPISNFSEYLPAATTTSVSVEAAAEEGAPKPAPAPRARRNIILFVEPVSLANFRAKELFDSIRKLLRDTVGPGDQVAITSWINTPILRQGFTDDVPTLTKTVDELEKESMGVQANLGAETRRQQLQADLAEQEYNAVLAAAGIVGSNDSVPLHALSAAKRQLFQIKQKTAVLESLMQSISGVEGKKIIIMATRRFGLYAGAEFFGGTVPFEYRKELDTASYRQSLVRTANANGITLYTIHPEGLLWNPDDPSVVRQDIYSVDPARDLSQLGLDHLVLMNETSALEEIAKDTGGLVAAGSRDIANILPRVSDDLEAYYSLGYRARATGKDSTRSIVVKVKNGDYVVRSRKQFVEKSDETRMKDRVIARLFQPVEGSSVAFDVVLGQFKKVGRKRWSVPLKILIPISELTVLPHGSNHGGEFSVYIVTGGVIGVMSDVQQRTQPFTIPAADLERASSSHFRYEFTLNVDEVADRVSVGVFDQVGKEFGLKRFTIPQRPQS